MPTDVNGGNRLHALIDEAAKRCGSAFKLSKHIGYSRNEVSGWRNDKRACPLEAQVFMAQIVGADVDQTIHAALIEKHADTPRGEKLVTALGKGLMTAGVLTASIACGNDALASNLPWGVDLLRCIFRAFL